MKRPSEDWSTSSTSRKLAIAKSVCEIGTDACAGTLRKQIDEKLHTRSSSSEARITSALRWWTGDVRRGS